METWAFDAGCAITRTGLYEQEASGDYASLDNGGTFASAGSNKRCPKASDINDFAQDNEVLSLAVSNGHSALPRHPPVPQGLTCALTHTFFLPFPVPLTQTIEEYTLSFKKPVFNVLTL